MGSLKSDLSLNRDGDTDKITLAIDEALKRGLPLSRHDGGQLKSGRVNFWPNTETITIDGYRKINERGLVAFLKLAERHDKMARGLPQIAF
jgi:hypothetical protein